MIDKFPNKIYMCFLVMILGTIVTYIFGTAWLSDKANKIACCWYSSIYFGRHIKMVIAQTLFFT